MPQGIPQSMPALATSPYPMNITQAAINPCTTTHGTYAIKPTDHLTMKPEHHQDRLYVVDLVGTLT